MKLRLQFDVDVPDGATHYYGEFGSGVLWYKCENRDDGEIWFWFDGGEWVVDINDGDDIKPIPKDGSVVTISLDSVR